MVFAKNYETVSNELKLCRKNRGLFFSDTVYISKKNIEVSIPDVVSVNTWNSHFYLRNFTSCTKLHKSWQHTISAGTVS